MTWSLVISILLFYGVLVVVNVPAPFLGLEFESGEQPKLWYAPPGFVIPIVWFVLFTLLGIAREELVTSNLKQYQWLLFGLAFLCATYAYYTLGLARLTNISALWYGLIGNIVVIGAAALVVYRLWLVCRLAGYLTAPVIVWTTFATLIVIGELRLEKAGNQHTQKGQDRSHTIR